LLAFRSEESGTTSGVALILYALCLAVLVFIDVKTNIIKPVRLVFSQVTYPISLVAAIPDRLFSNVDDYLVNEADIGAAYEHLRAEYVKLKAEMLKYDVIKNENVQLREFFKIANRDNLALQLAQPLQINLDPYQHNIVINKGLKQGVYSGQSVLDQGGIVGQVIDVLGNSSVVKLITDPAHSIPVQVRRNGLHTLVEGEGQFHSVRVPFLNRNVDIQEGDILETSGLGGRFPVGYPVAIVKQVINQPDEAFLQVKGEPIAAIESLRYVLLLQSQPVTSLQ
jgi:rod shape-determining protein MreC